MTLINFSGGRNEVLKHIKGGGQALEVREPLCYVNIFLLFYIEKKRALW
jgi:hypothetical protein